MKVPHVDAESDDAGCALTRKSTTGAHLFHSVNLFNARSWTHGTRNLGVAESEFYAGVKGQVQRRVSWNDVEQDESGHIHCPMLWLQEHVDTEIRTEQRKGEHNTADIGTKAVTAEVLRRHLKTLKRE